MTTHQYIDGTTGKVVDEKLFGDPIVRWLYSAVREKAPFVFRALTGPRISTVLGFLNYRTRLGARLSGNSRMLSNGGVDWDECLKPRAYYDTPEKIFERKIRYWDTRSMPREESVVVSPADSRVLVGSFRETSDLWLKEKFFHFNELLGCDKRQWLNAFQGGDFAIFRLTPEKYHYNHAPVSGIVIDHYAIDGDYHSCNPGAIVRLVTPFSKNKRMVTVIDTDAPGGSGVGPVAMIEVVALMIGEIRQCYSGERYEDPRPLERGLFLRRGQPKSLFRPGSSTTVLIFQKGRVRFDATILANLRHPEAQSRFSLNFDRTLVETDVKTRSPVAEKILD